MSFRLLLLLLSVKRGALHNRRREGGPHIPLSNLLSLPPLFFPQYCDVLHYGKCLWKRKMAESLASSSSSSYPEGEKRSALRQREMERGPSPPFFPFLFVPLFLLHFPTVSSTCPMCAKSLCVSLFLPFWGVAFSQGKKKPRAKSESRIRPFLFPPECDGRPDCVWGRRNRQLQIRRFPPELVSHFLFCLSLSLSGSSPSSSSHAW